MSKNLSALKAVAEKVQSIHPMTEGKEKGELLTICTNEELTINEFDIIEFDGKPVVIFTVVEHPDHYFYGGKVVTDTLSQVNDLLNEDVEAVNEFSKTGLPVSFERQESKNDKTRKYTVINLFPTSK